MALLNVNMMAILPQTIVLATALLVLILGAVGSKARLMGYMALVGVTIAGLVAIFRVPGVGEPIHVFQSMAVADRFALIITFIVAAATFLTLLASFDYVGRVKLPAAEYYCLVLLAAGGMMFVGAGTHFVSIYLSLEIFSIALYALAGLNRTEPRSGESALKYYVLGGFASAFLLYGMALIYGATGVLSLKGISAALAMSSQMPALLWVGFALLLIGFAFKIAAVPFHMWTPDVYQGAPTSVTAFMAAAAKVAGFAALVRLLVTTFPILSFGWVWAVGALAVVTMTWGNLAALSQLNLKRMLAYSSIAHAGYILVGVAAGGEGVSGVAFYLLAYTFMNIGAFAVLIALEREGTDPAGIDLERVTGLFDRRPWLATAMTIFMLSLAGIPPLVGFLGKLYVFGAAVRAGLAWLAIIGVINSVISAYYYVRVIARMALQRPTGDIPAAGCPGLRLATALTAVLTVAAGLFPVPLLSLVQVSVSALFGG